MKLLVALVVVLGTPLAGGQVRAAQPVTAVATADRDTITLGDRVTLAIVVDADAGYQVADPTIAREVGVFEVLQALATRKQDNGGRVRWTFRYLVTAWTLGALVVPPVEVPYLAPDGSRGAVRTAEVPITVSSVRAPGEATTDIKPLKPQLDLPAAFLDGVRRLATGVAGAAAIGGLAALVFWLILRRGARGAGEQLTPVRRALGALDQLVAERLPEQGRTEEHYARLVETMRRYVVERYAVDPGRTSREIRVALERSGLERAQAAAIYEILREGDEVRFRHRVPYPSHAQNTVRAALDVVRRAASAEEYETAALQPQ